MCNSLEGKRAAKVILGSSEVGLFGRRAAEQQELMWRVHELQLLLARKGEAERSTSVDSHQRLLFTCTIHNRLYGT